MSGRYTPDQGNQAYWLLDVVWAGRTWRVSDAEVVPVDSDGDALVYFPGLDEVSVSEDLADPADGTAASVSASMDVLFPEDVSQLIAAGYDLSSARAQLSRWVEGTAYEARRVVVDGSIEDPEYGEEHETVGLTVEMAPWLEESEVPDADAAVHGANWGDDMILSLASEELGLAYPVVYGRPGSVSSSVSSVGWITGSEGVWVDHQLTPDGGSPGNYGDLSIVIAGHHVSATTVYLNTDDFTEGRRFKVRNTTDFRGQPVAVVGWWYSKATSDDEWAWDALGTYTYGASPVWSLGATAGDIDASYHVAEQEFVRVHVGWRDEDDLSAGGKLGPDGTLLRNAADVLADLLGGSSAGVDRGRFATAAPYLSRFNLDFAITERVRPWEFLSASVLPLLPISIVTTPQGVAPVVWRYGAPASEAVCRLDTGVDPSLERVSRITVDRSRVVNDISVSYARSSRTGDYCATARVRGDVVSDGDETLGVLDPYCAASQRRYRNRDGTPLVVAESLDASVVFDSTCALAVAQWRAAAFALARRWVDYEGSERAYGWLERGSIVLLTDGRVHLDDVVAIVTGLKVTQTGRVRLRLLLQEDPARDLHRA